MVKITIVPNKESFACHKDLICFHSPSFAAACNSTLNEGATRSITLSNIEVDDFGLLVAWLYTQQIDLDGKDRDANVLPLTKLWALAARFSITKIQNTIMAQLRPFGRLCEEV